MEESSNQSAEPVPEGANISNDTVELAPEFADLEELLEARDGRKGGLSNIRKIIVTEGNKKFAY